MFDETAVRSHFPMIQNHPDLVYLDNAATAFKSDHMIQVVNDFYLRGTSNVHRGDYGLSIKASNDFDHVRDIVKDFIHAKSSKEIVFTSGASQSLNWIAYSYGLNHLKKDDVILTTEAEHASNILPWFKVCEATGAKIEYIPMQNDGSIHMDDFKNAMHDKVKIFAIAYVSNVLGVVQPLKQMIQIAHEYGAITVIDAAQAVPHMPVDVRDLDCDYLAFSGHKLGAAGGSGVLYGKYDLLENNDPPLYGGGSNARFDLCGNILLKHAPFKYEAGTPNVEGVLSLGAAIEFLQSIGMENIFEHEKQLKHYAVQRLQPLTHVHLYNDTSEGGLITFNVDGIFAQDVASYLNRHNIAVRSGNHCAKILVEIIGTSETVRASCYLYNTKADIDRLVDALTDITLEKCIEAAMV